MPRLPFLRRTFLHDIFTKLAEGQAVDAISWVGLL